ncbi:MAG TPA: glucose 1-dehydrogenase [Streptosporangiaceae bacterium]|jgi:NAD(P)-dependent dehydrogenase (short-subunit alcohol dehydrogenase family)|nr:glucose 1-dehydrogenase [Streptosporangiaceae bacterium]
MNQPVVMVTGALTGIGRATAVTFARAGATVVVSGRHEDAGQALAGELKELGATAEFIYADVRSDDQLAALVNDATARYGRLDVAVNNAGTDGQSIPVADITVGQYAGTFDTNVLGTLLSMKHELRVMQAQRSGSIVNVSSIYGQKGFPGASLYVASKHAIIGLTRSAALEAAAYGVRVNAVGPGPVQTAMFDRVTGGDAQAKAAYLATVPQQRAGQPEEIAAAIAYISSPQAGYLTGQTIYLDGGMTAA